MSRRGLLSRLLLATLIGGVGVLVLGSWLGPKWVGTMAIERLEREAAERGIPLRAEGLRVGLSETRVDQMCVDALPPANGALLCARDIEVAVDLVAALRGNPEVRSVHVGSVVLDASAERGSLAELRASVQALRAAAQATHAGEGSGEGDDTGTPPPRASARRQSRPELPALAVDEVTISVAGQALPLEGVALRAVSLQTAPELWTLDAVLHPTGVSAALVEAFEAEVPAAWTIAASWPEIGRPNATLMFDTPLQAAVPGASGWSASLDGVRVAAMEQAALYGVRLAHASPSSPSFSADRVEIELREFTTALDELYIARLAAVGADLQLAIAADGRLVLPGIAASAGDGVPTEDAAPADDEQAAADATTDTTAPEGLWADRRWWERLPQAIELEDAALTLRVAREDGTEATFGVSNLSVTYAIRALNTQLDTQLRANLTADERPAGAIDLSAAWDWAHKSLELDLRLDAIALGAFAPLLDRFAPWLSLDGQLNLNTRFRQRTDRTIPDFSGSVSLAGLEVQLYRARDTERVPVFASALTLPELSYTWAARQAQDDDEKRLVWQQGDVQVGAATARFTPTLYRLELHRRRIVEAVDIAWEIPRQPAQQWFNVIPDTLLGPLYGTQMDGAFSWQFAFPIRWVADDDGVRLLDLDEPTVDVLNTDDVRLIALPEPVDVRRLNDAFSFVFRGPDDTVLRTINVPPPRAGLDEAPDDAREDAAQNGTASDAARAWVRLEQIAYPLLAAQLYREDGRFFTNSGVNWYQIRLVLEQAARDGWPERGASTISMQLIKNVFLTHERSVERKLQELFLTYWMTRLVPKERILEVYLNVIEWGPGINGIGEAAQHYFGVSPSELNLPQSVWLASITPAPRRRAAQRAMGSPPDWQMRWVHDLMRGMQDRGWITETELAKGLQTPIVFAGADATATERTPATTNAPAPNAPNDADEPWTEAAASPRDTDDAAAGTGDAPVGLRERPDPAARTRALIERQRPLRP